MTWSTGVVRFAGWKLLAVVVAAVGLGLVAWSAASSAQESTDGLLPTVAFLADAGNFPDALAAGAVAGPMGGPVLLTGKDSLDAEAARVLGALRPDLVVIAGGPAAVSDKVAADVKALGLQVRRVSGAGRTATAAALSDFAVELGFDRPVVTGVAVTSEMVPGLNAQYVGGRSAEELGDADEQRLADLEAAVTALAGRVKTVEDANTALTGRVKTLESANAELQTRLAGVSRQTVEGRDTLRLSGMNLQVVNGTGTTDGTPNGLGNVIIGYNAPRTPTAATRSGSHYMVVGDQHGWTSYGGLLAGFGNTASGDWASVSGGTRNTASGLWASVSGGQENTASGQRASVSGGYGNTASGGAASVSGGFGNIASSWEASVSGGSANTASAQRASVSGGGGNTASGGLASVSGGSSNTASGEGASVLGGLVKTVSGSYVCHPGCS
jgi:hypothetical protein